MTPPGTHPNHPLPAVGMRRRAGALTDGSHDLEMR